MQIAVMMIKNHFVRWLLGAKVLSQTDLTHISGLHSRLEMTGGEGERRYEVGTSLPDMRNMWSEKFFMRAL